MAEHADVLPNTAVWTCAIGPTDRDTLDACADAPMRDAVREAFRRVTGHDADIIESGWDGEFDD